MVTGHVAELCTEILRRGVHNFGRFAGLTTFGNAEDRRVMFRPQTGTIWMSEERAVFPAMTGKKRISITTICASCSKKFAEGPRQPGEIVWQSIVGLAI